MGHFSRSLLEKLVYFLLEVVHLLLYCLSIIPPTMKWEGWSQQWTDGLLVKCCVSNSVFKSSK